MTEDSQQKVREILGQVNDSEISSIRTVVSRIIETLNDPKSTARELKNIIQVDPPLTAEMLKLANSAYYSPRVLISEIDQALIWLGYDTVKELALRQKVCKIFANNGKIGDYTRQRLWKHSVSVATLGKKIFRKEFSERGEDAYVAGLLHNIGIIVLDQFCNEDFVEIVNTSFKENRNLFEVEQELLGISHTDIAIAVCKDWNLPSLLVNSMGNHHTPDEVAKSYEIMTKTLHISDYICTENRMGYSDTPNLDKPTFNKYVEDLGIEEQALELIIEETLADIAEMEKGGLF